jgi:hypothetical protein
MYKHGYKDFDLMTDRPTCPACDMQGTPDSCSFLGCMYRFSGEKRPNKHAEWETIRSDWDTAPGDEWTHFDETRSDGTVQWRRLVISVRRLPLSRQPSKLEGQCKGECKGQCKGECKGQCKGQCKEVQCKGEGQAASQKDVSLPAEYEQLTKEMDTLLLVDLSISCLICLEDIRPKVSTKPVKVRSIEF